MAIGCLRVQVRRQISSRLPVTNGRRNNSANPYLQGTEDRLKQAENEFALSGTTPERKRELRGAIAQFRAEVFTLKQFSFFDRRGRPYIVIPASFARGRWRDEGRRLRTGHFRRRALPGARR